MLVSSKNFYDNCLYGKTISEVEKLIIKLKEDIKKLKNILEDPHYIEPKLQIERNKLNIKNQQLAISKETYAKLGGVYLLSPLEKKAKSFNDNINFISKITFEFGGFFKGHLKIIAIISDILKFEINNDFFLHRMDIKYKYENNYTKDSFLNALKKINIGEWRDSYDTERFGMKVLDGEQWSLKIEYTNKIKPIEIYGSNAYPYNYKELVKLFGVSSFYED